METALTTATPLTIRPATIAASDHDLLVEFRESQMQWLSTIGSGDQWGDQSIKERTSSASKKARDYVERSERTSAEGWNNDWCRAFVAEDENHTPIAGLVLESKSPEYVRNVLPEQDEDDPFIYVAYLLSNRIVGAQSKGSGAALINFAKNEVLRAGVKRICLDCWNGNDRKLVR